MFGAGFPMATEGAGVEMTWPEGQGGPSSTQLMRPIQKGGRNGGVGEGGPLVSGRPGPEAGDTPGHSGEPRGGGAVHMDRGAPATETYVVVPEVVGTPARRARETVSEKAECMVRRSI